MTDPLYRLTGHIEAELDTETLGIDPRALDTAQLDTYAAEAS